MEYTLVYRWTGPYSPPACRETSHDINELINLASKEEDQYDHCYIRLPSGITVWTPRLGYIGKETRSNN